MTTILRTSELREGDLVEMISGGSRDIGRRFLIRSRAGNSGDSLALNYATKAGREDQRKIGWSGWYGDCTWRLIRRAGSGVSA
jgi:hypothetical protein